MRTGAMAAVVLNSAKVGPLSDGRLSGGKAGWGHEKNPCGGKGSGEAFCGGQFHGEICWLKLFDIVFSNLFA